MNFELHPNLAKKSFLIDLPLCKVLLEDEVHYPWIFLVPRRPKVSKIMDLKTLDQLLLLQEIDLAQRIMWKLFQPSQLNVAAIGNKTPQLHVHIIARTTDDPAWPHTVWDHPQRAPYSAQEKSSVIEKLKNLFLNPFE